jgi:glycosyltransferase involved in cell wall biosynthesis
LNSKLNILIITYYWPPSGGSGVQRWMYFSKYLKKMGHNPIVVTVDEKYASYNQKDYSLLNEIDNIETYKTKSFDLLKLYSFIKSGNTTKSIPQSYIPNKSFFDKFTSFIRLNFFIPDSRVGWNKYAYKKLINIISNKKIDCLITTGPPHSTHLVGLKIKNKYKLKWIVDLRDPWTEIFYLKNRFRFPFSKQKNKKLESEVLENSDAIITTVGEKYHKILSAKVSDKEKIFKIYNGFDKSVYEKISINKTNQFNIVFTGVLSKNHNYKVFKDAIELLNPKRNRLRIKLILAGRIDMDLKNIFSKNIEIDYKGYVNHEEAIRLIKSSHLLINFVYENTEETGMLSGKITEYVASGSPIINFSNSSKESEYVLKFSKKSFNANSSSLKKVVKFINDEYNDWIAGKYQKSPTDNIDSLSRESLTKRLLDIINIIKS